ncbi:HECT-domain-containing protein [Punctularia strigosozonata HHB-11173 SS5]|uniref:HECT-domain-containing protein n=1 Tax=Punctularia strigosozonata (strain HHB-11173) TaxID=741275 RepID=UPI0004417F99|nr:HECT-domain-containing protein [Punctularia strigosozonata HHB-11173 SS5]EIN13090.1 HECT-domain-containing protein [Punctularia strigosozonata HHB-11173 SS5]
MNTFFGAGDDKRRRINLGGTSSATSHTSIIDQAKARRLEREAHKRRTDAAVKVQSLWRGVSTREAICKDLKGELDVGRMMNVDDLPQAERDARSLRNLRITVLLGDDETLDAWAASLPDEAAILEPLRKSEREHWAVLLRRATVLLLRSVAASPRSASALDKIKVINALVSPEACSRVLGDQGREFCQNVIAYVLQRGLYELLGRAISNIPLQAKNTPSLPSLVSLATAPFSSFAIGTAEHSRATLDLIMRILTIPLLPNRLPIASLTVFSARLPFSALHAVNPAGDSSVQSLPFEPRAHLLANLQTFTPPRYAKISPPAFQAYLALLATLLSGVPPGSLSARVPSSAGDRSRPFNENESSDSEDEAIRVEAVSSFTPARPPRSILPELDGKTVARLSTLASPAHITSLLSAPAASSAGSRQHMFSVFLGLFNTFVGERDKIASCLMAHAQGGLIRELYRGYVRMSSLGKDGQEDALLDDNTAGEWVPLLLLVEVYQRALLTMGDDEFFASARANTGVSRAAGAGNPLTLDELTGWSRQLLIIAFHLYWRQDAFHLAEESGRSRGRAGLSWEQIRDSVTRCLVAIHAKDSRRQFTPPGHWIIIPDQDVRSFVEAALLDVQNLDSETSAELERSSRFSNPRTRNARLAAQNLRKATMLFPRLGILNNIPFAIPFDTRVSIFRNFVLQDMREYNSRARASTHDGWEHVRIQQRLARDVLSGAGSDDEDEEGFHTPTTVPAPQSGQRRVEISRSGRQRAVVRRGQVAKDGFDRLYDADLKLPIEITFIDQFGQEEAGIDGGGVFKEFFTSLCKEVFDTDRGLWLVNKDNELYPNPHSYATESHSLNWYRFIGRILGKAMYDGILVDVAFAPFFLAKWLGKQSFLDDLASLDPELYNGLIFLKNSTENPEELSLNFTVAVEEFGVMKTLDLIPNGSNVPVTRENKLQYIYLVSNYRLNRQIKRQSEAFFEGLSEMIDPKWLRMFNQQEVQILISGVNSPIDIDDLRNHTVYGGLYDAGHETIQLFWKVVHSLDHNQRRDLLRFVTSCSRPPLLGFKELRPNFAIRDAGGDEARLPTASTCVNLLKLPRYKTEAILRVKLLQAINANAGFDLS